MSDRLRRRQGARRAPRQGARRHAPDRHAAGVAAPPARIRGSRSRSVIPTGRSASTAPARSAPTPWRARRSCSTASSRRVTARGGSVIRAATPRRRRARGARDRTPARRRADRQGQVDGLRGDRAQPRARGRRADARRDRSRRVDRPARRRAALAHPRARHPPLARADRRGARGRPRRPDVGRSAAVSSRTRASACARRSSRPAWASRAPTSWSPRAAP